MTEGEVTAVDVERIRHGRSTTLRLAVSYKFSIDSDGPYTGESFWQPSIFAARRIQRALNQVRVHKRVKVRYRPDDPSISKLDSRAWHEA